MIYTVKNFLARNHAQLRYEHFLLFLIQMKARRSEEE